MEKLFQQLVDQFTRTNDLSEQQQETIQIQQAMLQSLQESIQIQQAVLKNQQKEMAAMARRLERIEDLQFQIAEILDRDLLSVLDQPLLF